MRTPSPFLTAGMLALSVNPTLAQCGSVIMPLAGVGGPNGAADAAVAWDPDGAGPQQPWIVVGGEFSFASNTPAANLAAWDPAGARWVELGGGVDGVVHALVVLPNGDLVAGGEFLTAGGVPVRHVARWNGTGWSPLGSGTDVVTALAALPNGDVVAATVALAVLRFDGAAWNPLGALMDASVDALSVLPNTDILAGGRFSTAGGVPAARIARWDGSSWHALGAWPTSRVAAIAHLPSGQIVAGGDDTVARWDGMTWHPVGSTFSGAGGTGVLALMFEASGDLLAAGDFWANGSESVTNVARWSGSGWKALSAGVSLEVRSIVAASTGLLVAGHYRFAGGEGYSSYFAVARWDGSAWDAVGASTDGIVGALAESSRGSVIAGGLFSRIGGTMAQNVAQWDGRTWRPLGGGTDGQIRAVMVSRAGDVYVGGLFTRAGGVEASRIARWNGSVWSPLGPGLDDAVYALAELPNGDVVAGGSFAGAGSDVMPRVARWDGMRWHALGVPPPGSYVSALALLRDGRLAVGGTFSGNVALWDGANWTSWLGGGLNGTVWALTALASGGLVAAGSFRFSGTTLTNHVARWDGTSWSAMGSGVPSLGPWTLASLPNDDVLLGGISSTNSVLRWNGTTWNPIGVGFGRVLSAVVLVDGQMIVGGAIGLGTGSASFRLVDIQTTCPAAVSNLPTTCVGPSGPITLVAETHPWVGSHFRTTASGFAPTAVAIDLLGITSPALPLIQLHPAGIPGCDLLASLEVATPLLPDLGVAIARVSIPNEPSLVGAVVFEQMLQVDLAGVNSVRSVSGSNGLRLTVGSL